MHVKTPFISSVLAKWEELSVKFYTKWNQQNEPPSLCKTEPSSVASALALLSVLQCREN